MTEQEPRYGDPHGDRRGDPYRYPPPGDGEWRAEDVRALRGHLAETQRQFADRIGTNQQTVSEWERRARRPRRMARRLLHLVAEQAGFYRLDGIPDAERGPAGDGRAP